MTKAELQRLKEEAARANKAYDAARKQWKAQQKAQARAARLEARNHSLHDLRKGSTAAGIIKIPLVPCLSTVLSTSEVATGEV